MLRLILPFLALSSGSIFGTLFKKRYEETLPLTIMLIPIILYIFYIFNILTIGFYIIIVAIIGMYGCFIYKFLKKSKEERQEILKNIFTPGLLVFVIVFLAIYFITSKNEVLLCDELRLWGAYPKILFYDGSLQLGANATLPEIMQSYEPGMPLFQYFYEKCFGIFTESGLFLAYALVGLAPLIAISKKITWKKWELIPIYSTILIILPLALGNSLLDSLTYYYTLYIDPMLGIYFGYTLYLTTQKDKTKFNYLLFLVGISLLVLLKDTGLLFAIFSIIAFTINELIILKNYKPKIKLKRVIYIIIPIIVAIAIFGSWKWAQHNAETTNLYSSTVDKSEVSEFLKNPTPAQKEIINTFINEIKNTKVIESNFSNISEKLTYRNLLILLAVLFIVLIILKEKKERKQYYISFLSFYACGFIFTVGLLILYLFSLHTVASFPRYASTIITSGVILLFLILCNSIEERKIKYYIIYLALISIFIFPLKTPAITQVEIYKNTNIKSEEYAKKIAASIDNKNESYILVFSDEYKENFGYVVYHHQIYMSLIDEGFQYPELILAENIEKTKETITAYDYAYFIVIDDSENDKKKFSEILGFEVNDSVLIKIDEQKNFIVIE